MSARPLNVAVDARCLNTPRLRGIGTMLYELIRRTAASGAVRWHLLADRPIDAPQHEHIDVSVFETKGRRFHAWEQVSLPRAVRDLGVDLLHAPDMTLPWWQPVPTVVTLHRALPWNDGDDAWPNDFYRNRVLPSAYRRAAAVIAVSDNARRDILARWPALKPKLHVVQTGVDERYLDARRDYRTIEIGGHAVKEPYLLYVGGADARQRLTWALQTWWGSSTPATSMVVCGVEPDEHQAVLRMVPRHLRERLFLTPFISEDEMPRLYMRAAAVLYPSLSEDLGLPVLEAQAVGTPVLIGDVGRLSELKGPGAVVLPIDDLQAWVRAVAIIVDSAARPAGPDRVAREWARQYSWDACIDRTLSVYHSIAQQDRDHRPPAPRMRQQAAS